MNISALYNDYWDKSSDRYNKVNEFIAFGLVYIIGHYFSNLSSYLVLTLCCRNNHTCNFNNDMLSVMLAACKEWPLQIVTANKINYKRIPGDRQYNVILTDSYESFLQAEIHTYTAENNKNEYYFIFLHTSNHTATVEMQKILEYCWENYLINCVIQIQNENGQSLIYSYFPFTEKHCRRAESVLVNEYNGTSLLYEELFPNKLKNLYGCPLRAALYHIPPYVYLSTDSNNVTYVSGGFEGKLLLELSRKLNFSLDIIVSSNDGKYQIPENGYFLTRALKMLHDRQADISFGSTRQTRKRMLLLTASMHYYQTVWSVMTLSEAFNLTSMETLMFPFTNNTWYLLTFIGILTSSIVTLLKLKLPKYLVKHLDHVSLDVLLITVGMPAICKPIYDTTRILKVTWILFSLVLRTVYQALLFHLIRTHVIRNVPQTLKELVAQNYSLIVDQHTFDGLQKLPVFKSINFIVMNTIDHTMPLAYLERQPIHRSRYMAAVVSLIRFQYYIKKHEKLNVFKVLPENIIQLKLCMYFAKHSFLVEQFNDVLMMFKGFGIIHAWFIQEIDVNYIKKTRSLENQIFGMKQLKMAFVLILVGYMMATIILGIELLYNRVKRYQRLNKCKLIQKIQNQ